MAGSPRQRHCWPVPIPGITTLVLPATLSSVATINSKNKVDDMTTANQNPLEIWETRLFKPWGRCEKTEFWVCQKTVENGQTCLNAHVAGPFHSEDDAGEAITRLNAGAIEYRLCQHYPEDGPDVHLVMTVKRVEGVEHFMDVVGRFSDREDAIEHLMKLRAIPPL